MKKKSKNTNFLVYLLLFGSCIASVIIAQSFETNICTGVEEGRSIPDYSDCSSFFRCNGGHPTRSTCPSSLQFNRIEERCMLFSQNTCFRCPTGQAFSDVPVDNNCIQFVRCFGNVARQQTCSDGLLFDPVLRQCNFERDVYCDCPTLDIPGWPVMIRDPSNCAM